MTDSFGMPLQPWRDEVGAWEGYASAVTSAPAGEPSATDDERRRSYAAKFHAGDVWPFNVTTATDPHFNAWAQTCPVGEWVHYAGPRFSANVYMTERPAPFTAETGAAPEQVPPT